MYAANVGFTRNVGCNVFVYEIINYFNRVRMDLIMSGHRDSVTCFRFAHETTLIVDRLSSQTGRFGSLRLIFELVHIYINIVLIIPVSIKYLNFKQSGLPTVCLNLV